MKVYRVKLTPDERAQLVELLSKGKAAARTLTHARILLKADEGEAGPRLSDEAIAAALDVNRSTVERVRIRCVEDGFEAALRPRPSRQLHPRKLDGVFGVSAGGELALALGLRHPDVYGAVFSGS